uniref:Uncharacterized protein n=1 Tax=Nothoprocta perdicaria TaxID=30464 RepID=A0A8C7EDS7_NOTPE
VLPVEPIRFVARDKELGAVSVGARVGHGQQSCEHKVLVVKLLPVDGFASSAVVVGEVASLTHELGNDAVEAAPFEAKAFLVGAKAAEILCWERGRGESRGAKQRPGEGDALLTHVFGNAAALGFKFLRAHNIQRDLK